MEEIVEYRGYVVFWRRFSNDGPWLAHIAAGSPSLFPATDRLAMTDIHGRNRDDMLVNAKIYIDRLAEQERCPPAELREPLILAHPSGALHPRARARRVNMGQGAIR